MPLKLLRTRVPRKPATLAALALGLGIALGAGFAGHGPLAPLSNASIEQAHADEIPPTAGGDIFSAEQKKAIGAMIKDYLIKNPDVIIEVQGALEAKLEKEQADKLKTFVSENASTIYRNPLSPVAGNADGDITVVEFFDYNCGYCKRGLTEVQKLIKDDPKVRVVMKEFPILSKGSQEAAEAALAAKRQGKYWEFHQAMLTHRGQANKASALKIAADLKLDVEKLKADMASPDVKAELAKVKELASKMGINGTPHFLVGDKSIPGAPEDLATQLESLVGGFRKAGCSYC